VKKPEKFPVQRWITPYVGDKPAIVQTQRCLLQQEQIYPGLDKTMSCSCVCPLFGTVMVIVAAVIINGGMEHGIEGYMGQKTADKGQPFPKKPTVRIFPQAPEHLQRQQTRIVARQAMHNFTATGIGLVEKGDPDSVKKSICGNGAKMKAMGKIMQHGSERVFIGIIQKLRRLLRKNDMCDFLAHNRLRLLKCLFKSYTQFE
jgi:hypothetical protein